MAPKRNFKKKRWIYFSIVLFLYLLFISAPFIFISWPPSEVASLNWDNPSIIANTINGIASPLLTIIAIWLTFEAFWVQYESNTHQIDISVEQKESGERQKLDLQKERFENRFFNLIQLLHDQEKDTFIPQVGTSKQAFHFMFYEFKAICYQVARFGVYRNTSNYQHFELDQAFHLFLNGVSRSSISRLTEETKGIEKKAIQKINEHLLKSQERCVKNGEMPKYLMDYQYKKIKLFDGHRLYLVSFYRAFCMTLQYLYQAIDQKIINDIELYRNTLLATFSEHEIALLRIMYIYGSYQNLMFIKECYRERIDTFFRETLIEKRYIASKTMNTESTEFIDRDS